MVNEMGPEFPDVPAQIPNILFHFNNVVPQGIQFSNNYIIPI